jgi:hypothetical protein
LHEYIRKMKSGMTRTQPEYVFENLRPTDSDQTMTTGVDDSGHNTTLRDGILAAHEWRPGFLQSPHDAQFLLKSISHQFFLGSIGTGAPIHWHGPAWNVCAYGQRRWFLFPPSSALYSNIPISEWIKEDYPRLTKREKPLECMQHGGDIMFVPPWWGHGTYTVQDSVGIAVELTEDTQFVARFPARHAALFSEHGAASPVQVQPVHQHDDSAPAEFSATFINNAGIDIEMFWVNAGDGTEVLITSLPATRGSMVKVNTFPAHVWRARQKPKHTSAEGELVVELRMDTSLKVYKITTP